MALAQYQCLVIKVGSSLLVDDDGALNRRWLDGLAADVAMLVAQAHNVLIVSSGAIAIGSKVIGINKRRARLDVLQAAAAAGQVQLVHAYQDALSQHQLAAAQVLLTPEDTEDRRRFLNARGTLAMLLESGVVPIINENDTVATAEIRYGDNDRLAARVAQLVMADALILLSDVDGLYSSDPGIDSAAQHIDVLDTISDETLAMAGAARSDVGSGGMKTKLMAAQIATRAGCSTIITNGTVLHPLQRLIDGARHTLFRSVGSPAVVRQQWLAGVLEVRGSIQLDRGAIAAVATGKSLLPIGMVSVRGQFSRGDVISLLDDAGAEVGRGLAEYARDEAEKICGCHSESIAEKLGYQGRSVMVHCDDLVFFDNE